MALESTASVSVYGRRAFEHAKALAKPRRTGSPQEEEARRYVSHQLRSLGYKVSEEPFTFHPMESEGWRGYLAGLAILALLVPVAAFSEMRLACAVLGGGLLLFGLSAASLLRQHLRHALSGKTAQSANLFSVPPGPPCLGPRVLLCAHYDSKSQSFSLRSRILLITGTVIGVPLLAFLGISLQIWPEIPSWVPAAAAGVLLAMIAALFFSNTQDRSPGATDNAASVGILLELAERLRFQGAPHGKEVAFFFSGAEEEGAIGAMSFLGEHAGALHERAHQVINLDIVGHPGKVWIWGGGKNSHVLEELLRSCAAKERIRLGRLPLVLGAAADHLPFASAGVPAVTLTSPFGVWGRVHTSRDTVDLLAEQSLGELVRILELTVRSG